MRIHSSLLCCTLLIVACGGVGGGDVACTQEFWNGEVGTCLPEGWVVIDAETLRQRGVPADTIVGFQSEEAVSGQFPTVTITKEALSSVVDAATYSDASIRSVEILPNYKLLDTQNAVIDEQEVKVHVFTAQPVAEEPPRRFYQLSTVSGNAGYSATGMAPVSISEDMEKNIGTLLTSLTFVEPGDGATQE